MRLFQWALLCSLLLVPRLSAQADTVPGPDSRPDPYLWLEDANGPRALAWVKAENAKTVAVLEHDPHYATLHAEALAPAPPRDADQGRQSRFRGLAMSDRSPRSSIQSYRVGLNPY
jgi:prolyl oligopeptidase